MVEISGQTLSRRGVAERMGMLAQVAGVRLVTLGDGIERGNRVLEFRTGGGLRFTVMVDRGFDVAECDYRDHSIGWHSPAGFRHPSLHEYEGEGGLAFTRSFSGLVATCGLDHTMGPVEVPADSYNYPGRKTVKHSLHGRVSLIPARLTGYGETWDGDACTLWAEGVVQQSAMFAEDLYLHRRIEADLGGREIRVIDRVENHGFLRTPHMFFYHVNVGWPLLDEGARYLAPVRDVLWASHAESYEAQGVGYAEVAAPREGFREQVWEHDLAPDGGGECPAALVNDRLGIGFEVVTRKDQLPCFYEWQNYAAGNYALGIEPSTHHILGEAGARERGEMIWLEHGETRDYVLTMRVLDGAGEIGAAADRIAGIARQPADRFPAPSGRFAPLGGGR
jgi:hypothetical protein